ncbi:MAG: amino acid decarboxylase, partial [bacterium]|nr:amino acid decarboxylase [bacterium]
MNTSGSLDIENLEHYIEKAAKIITGHIDNISRGPVMPPDSYEEVSQKIFSDLPLEGEDIDILIDEISSKIVPSCTKIGHPRFLSWIITSPAPAGTIGELINVGINQVPALYKGGKASTVLEEIVIKWFCELFGYDSDPGGILVSGGTMANLTALAAAREAKYPGAMKTGIQNIEKPLIIYVSDQGHISVDRSAGMLGIGADMVRKIPTDDNFRMRLDLLEEEIFNDRSSGFDPFCVVAQAGAVNTGSIDPIDELANLCSREDLWFHVDAS